MDIYKLQQDRTEIQNQYEYELNQFQEAMSVSNLVALGFVSKTNKGALNRLEIALNRTTIHCDVFDNRIFTFYQDNKLINLLTIKDVINFINYVK